MQGSGIAVSDSDLHFKLIEESDIPLLHEWLNRPHVAEWWDGPISFEEVLGKYLPRIQSSTVKCYIAYLNSRPLGFIQGYRADEGGDWWSDAQDHGVCGIDQYIADPDLLGRGLGRLMITNFAKFLFSNNRHITRIQADPAQRNVRAIHCYKAVGFKEVGNVDTPDGKSMLMVLDRKIEDPV